MSDLYWGTVYLVDRDVTSEAGPDDDSKIRYSFESTKSHMYAASELLALADRPERARRFRELMDLAFTRRPAKLHPSESQEMLDLTDAIEEALIGRVVDEKWNLRPDQIDGLRDRTKMFDFSSLDGHVAEAAVAEGMYRLVPLRETLKTAIDQDLDILMES